MITCCLVLAAMAAAAHAAPKFQADLEYGRAAGESLRLDACVPDGPGPFAAVILVHGDADTRVPHQQSVDLQAALKKAGVPCDLITVKGGQHGMRGWAALGSDYPAQVMAWLQRALRGPGPTSAR